MVFLGLISGQSLCLPKKVPAKKAPTSATQADITATSTRNMPWPGAMARSSTRVLRALGIMTTML